jgi:general secretion pathway protein F
MPQQVTLDQLIALNDEIAALARAGVPLDEGLLHLGRDLPGRLGKLSRRLGERLEAGEPLTRVLEDEKGLPPAYRAIVAAGIRSGRLAVALEGLSTLVRRAAEMRRTVAIALVYPLLVLALAYALFAFMLVGCFPVMLTVFRDFLPDGGGVRVLERVESAAPYWLPWLPVAVVVPVAVWWFRSRRAWSLEGSAPPGSRAGRRGHRQSFRSVLQAGRLSVFAETLALLLQQDVPLEEAVELAADASADRSLREACRQLAERLRRGESARDWDPSQARPLVAWLLAGVQDRTLLIAALRRAAEAYRRHANWALRWLSVYLPLWLTVAIGGTAVMLYAVSVFGPWCRVLYELSVPP